LDWGDAIVDLPSGTSKWSNPISGTGGLIKRGAGKLVLSEPNTYTGRTQVLGGELEVQREIVSPITIGPGGTLSGYARFGPTLNQGGTLRVDNVVRIVGDYTQTATGRTSMLLGSWFYVEGTATLAGDLHVLGARQGYTANSHTNFLSAGALVGRYDTLTSAAGVLMDATVMYSATEAWLDVRRLDVTAAAQSLALGAESVGSAQRVEGAFDAIDAGQVDGAATGDFMTGAGAIQGSPTAAAAQQTLESLSGELHGADTAFAMMAIEGNRRALESRIDALQDAPMGGAWFDDLDSQRALARFDMQADGWMAGQDRRMGALTVGAALAQTEGYAHHDQRFDREHNRQLEAQFYASYDLGQGYLLGSLAVGRMQRWTRRDVLLGVDAFRIGTDYAQRYASVGVQAGLPMRVGNGRITPYFGVQNLQLERDGFSEQGAFGFGLSTADSSLRVSQALLGARYSTGWSVGASHWDLQARAEWQRLLSQSGDDIQARFTAMDVWSPILGGALDRDVGVLGMSVGTWLRGGSRLGFDVDVRHDQGDTWTQAMLNWSTAF
jgi:autotransporter-associated beta strand protein